jgi:hypothetical protein
MTLFSNNPSTSEQQRDLCIAALREISLGAYQHATWLAGTTLEKVRALEPSAPPAPHIEGSLLPPKDIR